jgi:hypothetical protein
MKETIIGTALTALLTMPALAQSTSGAAGRWEGEIQIPGRTMPVAIDFDRNAAGVWIGSLTIPGTTTVDVPVERISIENTAVRFSAHLPGETSFDGTLSADAQQLSGLVSNAQGGVPFQLVRKGAAAVKVPPTSTALSSAFEGVWEGAIAAGPQTIRLRVTLSAGADGIATGVVQNLEQGEPVPVTTVTINGRSIELDVRLVSGVLRGALADTGEISGEWVQGGMRAPLTMRRSTPR